ncbi:MAG: YdeI/OmpD-associated family protein, partial [Thermoleophilaceae bacterium]
SQAVDEALCFGWIDGVLRGIDDARHIQRFTPRKPTSNWSAINIAKVEQLRAAGRMRPAGEAAFERRRDDRSAIYSYEQRRNPVLEPEQEARFKADAAAWEYFKSRPPSYRKPASNWSAVNIAKVEQLRAQGRMRPAGEAAFERRRDDRSAIYSYEQRRNPVLEPEQEARFKADAAAWEYFTSRPPSYRKPALWWVISAKKPETRERRLQTLIEDSAAGRTIKQLTPRKRKS